MLFSEVRLRFGEGSSTRKL